MALLVKWFTLIVFCYLCQISTSCWNNFDVELNFSRQSISDVDELKRKIQDILFKDTVIKVDLSFNELLNITSDILKLLPNVKVLNLSHNNISYLEPDLILNNKCLQKIDLSYNALSYIPNGLLGQNDELSNLEVFIASHNHIKDMGLDLFHENLKVIKKVDLSYNKLESFEPWPYRLSSTTYINDEGYEFDLSHNDIYKFSNRMNHYIVSENGFKINMNFNNLTGISLDDFTMFYTPGDTISAYNIANLRLNFAHNPWKCDCKFYPFIQIVDNSFLRGLNQTRHFIICAEPMVLKGKFMYELIDNPHLMVCNLTKDCPPGCLCEERPCEKQIVIDCSQLNNMTRLPINVPTQANVIPKSEIKLNLNMYDNKIESLTVTKYTKSLISLNISKNRLSYIEPKFFLETSPNLTLDISYNMMKSLPKTIQKIRYKHLYFQDNPLQCSCEFMWFNDWNRLHIKHNNYTCEVNGKIYHINTVTYHSLHCYRDIAILVSCIIIPILVILVLSVVVYQKWKYETLVILKYLQNIKRTVCSKESSYHSQTDFSTYISSNIENEEIRNWIRETLLNKLDVQFGLKTYYPPRDNPADDCIIDVMIEKIIESQNILVVLDRTYLNRGWCIEEFHQAHRIVCEDSNKKIIVLLYENEILDETIEHESLNTYLSQKLYIQRTELLTWPKLKYELYHS